MNEQSHKFATYWVAACIGLHAFAMQCEDEDNSGSDDKLNLSLLRDCHHLTLTLDQILCPKPLQGQTICMKHGLDENS